MISFIVFQIVVVEMLKYKNGFCNFLILFLADPYHFSNLLMDLYIDGYYGVLTFETNIWKKKH